MNRTARAMVVGITTLMLLAPLALAQTAAAQDADFDVANPAVNNGEPVVDGEFPHLVGVLFSGSTGCGGSLLAPTWVVTASHCLDGETPASVSVGLGSANNQTYAQVIDAKRLIQHPEWNGQAVDTNDIALIELDSPADLRNPNIGVIALNRDPAIPSIGATTTVAGWGDIDGSAEGSKFPDVAQKADILVEACTSPDTSQLKQVCALGTEGRDSCSGDSGGPLIFGANNDVVLVATVEFGFSVACDGSGGHGVYQRVSPHVPWLESTMGIMSPGATCNGLSATAMVTPGVPFFGTDADDVIVGTSGDDTIYGRGGNDTICALGGRDVVRGGAGDDFIDGGKMIDRIWGDAGDDLLIGEGGSDRIRAGSGNDEVRAGSGADRVWGGPGDDTLVGMGGQDFMWGDAGNDTLQGNFQSDRLRGGDGNDVIRGAGGRDKLYGDAGDDELYGGANTDYLEGGAGTDAADGQAGRDRPLVAGVSGCDAEDRLSC